MAANSLNQNIFRLMAGVVVLTSLTIIINVWFVTAKQAQDGLDRNLEVAQNILEQVLANRENLLFNSASVLTDDFGFKQALASYDKGTIDSALLNHGNRINADVMALVSLRGDNITSVPSLLEANQLFPYQTLIDSVLKEGSASALIILEGELFQVIMLTVNAPTPIAIAVVGFKLDSALVNQLHSITQLETTIQVLKNDDVAYSVSTLCETCLESALKQTDGQLSWSSIAIEQSMPFVSRQFTLSDELGYSTQIILSEDIHKLFKDFKSLQINIVTIGGLAIVLAMLFAALLARRLAKPLATLAELAHGISTGDYSKKIHEQSNTLELKQLSATFNTMQTNIQAREEKIIFQARHDILTSLYNRHHIETLLKEKFESEDSFVAIGINIFGFRGINDIFGYNNGDICLKELAKRVSKIGGLSARLTGGELLWVPNEEPNLSQIEAIKNELEKPINTDGVVINLKVAMGLLYCPVDSSDAEDLFRRMNIVLDEAQITRQFILPYNSELEERYSRRLSIITELKHTLANAQDELNLFYQPKMNLVNGQINDVEALIRWNNAKLGFVSPEDFIAIAEHAGFIEHVTEWVIDRAIRDAVKFKDNNVPVKIAINLSAKDLMNLDLLPAIQRKLDTHQLETECLSFEITEGDLVKDHQKAIEQLHAYRKQGFSLAIDDFGTGYSSMAYLQSFPVNTLKVDKSFVLKLDTQQGDQHIVKTVIDLAHSFSMTVVAEGVENHAALELLRQWGCEWAQGYHISRPTPPDQLIEWHKQHNEKEWL